jgi:GWxTD domain-containing protein
MFARLVPAALVCALLATQSFAQKKAPASDPTTKPRKEKSEPRTAFRQWVADVGPIITPQELNAWNKLQSDDEREKFILDFWHRRDPDTDTDENEYREEYYERLAYVNEHFSSGVPGYKTDRGVIYLRFGRPDEIETHPAGGAYERDPSEGGGSSSAYPFERWWYRNLPGRSDVQVEFVDPTGSGEYRIARNPFEKDALLHVPGTAPPGIDPAQYVSAAGGIGNPFSARAQDSAFEWLGQLAVLNTPPPVDFDRLRKSGNPSPILEDSFLNTEVQISYFKQSDDHVIVSFTIQTDNRDLVFQDVGGIQTARVNISGRITTVADRRAAFFEDAVTTTAMASELNEARTRKSAYQKAVSLAPGRYRVDVLVRDTESGLAALRHIGFEVPKFGTELTSSSLILASVLEQVSDVPASRQFVIGDRKVIPNLTGMFHRGAPIGIYLQLYNAGIDQTTLRPSVNVEYALIRDGKEVGTQVEDWHGIKVTGDRVTLARLIDSARLFPGDYQVEVRAQDRVTGRNLVKTGKFTIVK